MSIYTWMVLAFVAGLTSVIAYYKNQRWIGCFTLLVLPIAIVALLGWPYDSDFEDTSLFSIALWAILAFAGSAIGTTAVVLRIVR